MTKIDTEAASAISADTLIMEFQTLTGCDHPPADDLRCALVQVFAALGFQAARSAEERRQGLCAAINSKLKLTQAAYQQALDVAAAHGTVFHYHDKVALRQALDRGDRPAFFRVLLRAKVAPKTMQEVAGCFRFITWHETRAMFLMVMAQDGRAALVHRSVFSAYAFECFKTEAIHLHFSNGQTTTYYPSFYGHLRHVLPDLFERPVGLICWKIDDEWLGDLTDSRRTRRKAAACLAELASRLSNHCYFGILIKPLSAGEAIKWRLYSDIVLYAEKGHAARLETGYFHPEKVAAQTSAHIGGLDMDACQFDIAQEGLFYKDCFVINYPVSAGEQRPEPDLLLLFEKNERDETPIPCPACRSSDVRGNSYPVLGVRSWECANLLCPERSKYDRGNRYSAASLIRQEAIEEDEAVIPQESLRLWKRDVVSVESEADVLTMLVRHYSLLSDTVLITNMPWLGTPFFGRRVVEEATHELPEDEQTSRDDAPDVSEELFDGPFFRRICVDRPRSLGVAFPNLSEVKGVEVYCGDCFEVLGQIDADSVDGVVTSPPYYNAREYAHWSNIYCFLYDQYNVARELHRVMKPGGLLLYNVFDYFDNENNIVFSAMGKKRMILGAYAIHLFERVGLEVVKNVMWDKGEIEGKRNFNQGNRSPYYQAPFNCWEHILVFRKPGPKIDVSPLPGVLRAQPVVKMIGGRNILGHTAPYPEAIPNLILDLLDPRSTVLDPFSGSMTTARATYKSGRRSISIDYKPEYCRLGLRLLVENERHLFNTDE